MQINQMQVPSQQNDLNKIELQTQQIKPALITMDQSTPNTTMDDNLTNIGSNSASTSYNQKTQERMRLDEGNFNEI